VPGPFARIGIVGHSGPGPTDNGCFRRAHHVPTCHWFVPIGCTGRIVRQTAIVPKTIPDGIHDVAHTSIHGNFGRLSLQFVSKLTKWVFQVQNEQDKSVLQKYKNAVEKRLHILERQGLVTSVIEDKNLLKENDWMELVRTEFTSLPNQQTHSPKTTPNGSSSYCSIRQSIL